jgi:hypothetical protein
MSGWSWTGFAWLAMFSCASAGELRLSFDHYYDQPQVAETLRQLHAAYPGLTRLESLGKSEEGRDIWALTITNFANGADTDKPGIYTDGAIHGNEIQATEVCLYLAWTLLDGYERNPEIRKLVDERTFYIVPTVNVDSRARYFEPGAGLVSGRSARVAHDDDRDGLADEDDYEDLDGDGEVVQMRVRDPMGPLREHPEDPRVLIPAEAGKPGQWRLLGWEGLDNDGDGKLNEDPVGYLDMNRNYGYRWQPRYVQEGAGDFPLSAKPTRAVADFVLSKPNLVFQVAFHNWGGLFIRGPGSKLAGPYPPDDLKVYDTLGHEGEKIIPGYRYIVGVKDMYTTHGDFDEWVYSNLGVQGFTGELYMSSQMAYRKPGPPPKTEKEADAYSWRLDPIEQHKFDENLALSTLFVDWKQFDHPQFGKVEIGGWRKLSSRMPPPFQLPELVHRNAALVLFIARQAPVVALDLLGVDELGDGLSRVRVRLSNPGVLPSMSAMSRRHNLARQDLVRIEGRGLEVVSGGVVEDLQLDRVTPVEHRPSMVFCHVPGLGHTDVQFVVRGQGQARISFDSLKARNRNLEVDLGPKRKK